MLEVIQFRITERMGRTGIRRHSTSRDASKLLIMMLRLPIYCITWAQARRNLGKQHAGSLESLEKNTAATQCLVPRFIKFRREPSSSPGDKSLEPDFPLQRRLHRVFSNGTHFQRKFQRTKFHTYWLLVSPCPAP